MAHNRLKNVSTAVSATKHATRILLKEANQKLVVVFFVLQKTALFSPSAEQTDATQACYKQA